MISSLDVEHKILLLFCGQEFCFFLSTAPINVRRDILWLVNVAGTDAYAGLVPDYQMPFEEEVGQHPTMEEMQNLVVAEKKRPRLPDFSQHKVRSLLQHF